MDGRRLVLSEAVLVQLEEQPLGPLVVRRVCGAQLVGPVEHAADAFQLLAEPADVALDQRLGMDVGTNREVLAMDAEGVEPDRLEHVVAAHPREPAVDIGAREGVDIAHVQALG